MFLIDTSAWIFALRKEFHPRIKQRVDRILSGEEVAINGMIMLELLMGTGSETEYRRLLSRLSSLYYIESGQSLWESASKLAFDLRRAGMTIPATDIFIAASGISTGAILLHADSHFDLIATHTALRVESLVNVVE